MLSSSSPARRAFVSQQRQLRAQALVRGEGSIGERSGDERPHARPTLREAFMLELPVGLQHRVGIDRDLCDDLLHRRQLITLTQNAETQRLADLLHQLPVRGNT